MDEPIVMYTGSGTTTKSYYHTDAQGSVIALTDTSGTVTDKYVYTPFGDSADAPTGNPIRYTGRRFDAETGLYYYRARYYSPTLGRFLQTDPIGYGDNMNMYVYVDNDPLDFRDPTGMCAAPGPDEVMVCAPPPDPGFSDVGVLFPPIFATQATYNWWNHSSNEDKINALIFAATIEEGGSGVLAKKLFQKAVKSIGAKLVKDIKITGQQPKRGWTNEDVKNTVDNPHATREAVDKSTGGPATAYYTKDGHYVVVNDSSHEVVQISDKTKAGWVPDSSIKDPYKP